MSTRNLLPGEFRAYGRRAPKAEKGFVIDFVWGADFPVEQAKWLRAALEQPQRTLLQVFDETLPHDAALLTELHERGYDMATFRFRVCTQASEVPRPKRWSVPRQRPGHLHGRWGRLDYDSTGDFVVTWERPCKRPDSSLLLCWLSMATYGPQVTRANINPLQEGLLKSLPRRGLDKETLKISVRHLDVSCTSVPAAAAQAELP